MLDFAVFARFPMLVSALLFAPAPIQPDASAETVTVAAVMFTGEIEPECEHDSACAIESLVRIAAGRGAELVVTPEYAFESLAPDSDPTVGEAPGSSTSAPLLVRFSALADELDLYLVIDLETRDADHRYNTQVAFDPDGVIVAKHHKFELYGAENQRLSRGADATAFETPFGRVGLLICADVYGPPRLHERMVSELGVDIVAMSAMWTVAGASRWQAAFAHDWQVHLVAANRSAGAARGGGVFDREGRAVAASESGHSEVVLAEIPRAPGR